MEFRLWQYLAVWPNGNHVSEWEYVKVGGAINYDRSDVSNIVACYMYAVTSALFNDSKLLTIAF